MQPIRQANLLEVNEFLVLDYIRERGQTTRGQVERDLGISRASVSRIVRRLYRAGAVIGTAGSASHGGRPSDILEFNYQGGSVIAATGSAKLLAGNGTPASDDAAQAPLRDAREAARHCGANSKRHRRSVTCQRGTGIGIIHDKTRNQRHKVRREQGAAKTGGIARGEKVPTDGCTAILTQTVKCQPHKTTVA